MIKESLKIEELLRGLGLTKYESKVYLALLDIGKATSGQILKKAELKTGKIYEILDSLEKKGFISIVTENGIKNFSPAEPTRIYEYLEKQKEIIKNQELSLKEIMPSILERIKSHKEGIKIEIFTGYEGYKTVCYKEMERYKKGNVLYVFGVLSQEKYPKNTDLFFMNNVQPKRIVNKIKIKKIFSEEARKEKRYIEKGAEVRYLPYTSMITTNIIEDLTIIEIFANEIIMITIESFEVAKSFREQFDSIWKIAKP